MQLPDETGAELDPGQREGRVTGVPLECPGEPDEAPPQGRGDPPSVFSCRSWASPRTRNWPCEHGGWWPTVRLRPAAAELIDAQGLERRDLLDQQVGYGRLCQRAVSRLRRNDRRPGARQASRHGVVAAARIRHSDRDGEGVGRFLGMARRGHCGASTRSPPPTLASWHRARSGAG
jgi:hypothetical protein